MILETRKQDVLDGEIQDRTALLQQPFVRSNHWTEVWGQVLAPATGRLRQPVLIVVAPRSSGSTTFALRLLAEHTAGRTHLMKLDADWPTPSKGRLPLEKDHAYQLDLKHPVHDALSADFLGALSKHAENLNAARSHLVLTVAEGLWTDHHLGERDGIQVVRLRQAPDAQQLIEARLDASGYSRLVTVLRSSPTAQASVRGLSAVAAARAARTVVEAWQEHNHHEQQPGPPDDDGLEPLTLAQRIEAALTDWREELDTRFGETTVRHSSDNPSLTLEDRCLLLALAVWQSAPMPQVTRSASRLQAFIEDSPAGTAALSPAHSVFASRGLRRRIKDVGADVDTRDVVVFDRPTYGRAVLEYVWDNYDVMREPLINWLVSTAVEASPEDRAVNMLTDLTVRHGTVEHLDRLGKIAGGVRPDVLGTVMDSAVRNEHIGRLAWSMLYRWAAQQNYALVVIAVCRRILAEPDVTTSAAKMAMVRLRRVAQSSSDKDIRRHMLASFEELSRHPAVTARLVAEVSNWQQNKVSAHSGSLAFLALMTASDDKKPWLIATPPPDIDIVRAVHDLLGNPDTAKELIPRLTAWIRSCADDPDAYAHLREQLLPALRGHNMFQAGMSLMQELRGISTTHGTNVADDFYQHLVDPRLRTVFPIPGDAA
ncbi:hypothetical protein OHB56_40805 [Streptomyces sp. NBC_01635]|uniref:hypothetical protein n=1 Tax=Streptomyces sp. NBC_01635 TaxID=2975904 RepID=UPI0038681B26|nr:hypothetical protein OHB56_00105 [Streptomyces sp. NBC_01635]WTD79570.1 hypothetical protein OHB56_40805 [Streptomyces sp. NBC_01635]